MASMLYVLFFYTHFYPNSIHSILSFTLEPSAMNRIYMILTKSVSVGSEVMVHKACAIKLLERLDKARERPLLQGVPS